MAAFVLLYYIKRNDRFRNKLAEITHIKGLSTNYYQVKFLPIKKYIDRKNYFVKDLCRQRMQVQPTGSKSQEIPKIHQTSPSTTAPTTTTTSAGSHVKHNSEGSSTRSSTSSWFDNFLSTFLSYISIACRSEEPVAPVNMDIMTGHLILVRTEKFSSLSFFSTLIFSLVSLTWKIIYVIDIV